MPTAERAATVAIVASLAFVSATGCYALRDRRGFVLRSEWTLEVNRNPCLNGGHGLCEGNINGVVDQPVACNSSACGCPNGPIIYPPFAGRRKLLSGAVCPPVCRSGVHEPVAANADSPMHSRFHPLPTAPVFSRRDLPPGIGASFGPIPSDSSHVNAPQLNAAARSHDRANSSPLQQPQSVAPSLVMVDGR